MLGNGPVQFGKGATEKGWKVPRRCPTSFDAGKFVLRMYFHAKISPDQTLSSQLSGAFMEAWRGDSLSKSSPPDTLPCAPQFTRYSQFGICGTFPECLSTLRA